MATRRSRVKKPSAKATESTETWRKTTDLSQKWCKVYCEEDGKCHTLNTKSLEPEDSEDLLESDLAKGNTILWKCQGKKYTTTIVEVYDKPPGDNEDAPPRRAKRSRSQHAPALAIGNGANNSDSDGEVKTKSAKKTSKQRAKVYGSSGSESDDKEIPDVSHTVSDAVEVIAVAKPTMSCNCNCGEEIADLKSMVFDLNKSLAGLGELQDLSRKFTGLGELQMKVGKVYSYLKQSRSTNAPSVHASPSGASLPSVIKTEEDAKYISDKGVSLLSIRAINPAKYALALMDAIFSDEEMATSCFSAGKRSTKPQLPQDKIKLLEDCIDRKYGEGTLLKYEVEIKKKCNQKCIDVCNKRVNKDNPATDKKQSKKKKAQEEHPKNKEEQPENQEEQLENSEEQSENHEDQSDNQEESSEKQDE